MIRRLVFGAFLAVAPLPLSAQAAEQLLTQGRQAFENLDFEQAARLLTRVLDVAAGATTAQRDTAQLYLGVSYEYAGQRANAVSAFRAFIRSSPCAATPEQYGAGVAAAYVEAQGGLFAAAVCEVRQQEVTRETGLVLRVAATRPAFVRALMLDGQGRSVADLGEVEVTGVTTARWRELPDPAAFPAEPSRFQLLIRSRAVQGPETDERTVPVEVHAPLADTLVHPSAPAATDYRPERRPVGPALGDLGKGVAIGVGVVAASTALASKSLAGESTKALAVGGAISFAGLAAFITGLGKRDIPENRTFNAELQRTWEAQRDSVAMTNRARRSNRPILIGPPGERR